MKNLTFLSLILLALGCSKSTDSQLIYSSKDYQIFSDKVVQGNNVASVLSSSQIVSNYKNSTQQDSLVSNRVWKLKRNISSKPQFISDIPLVDALYNLSVEEALTNIEPDTTFRTGAKWGGVWTRDVSFSIFLAFAYHQPDVAMNCLMKKVRRGRIVQDTGSGGAWPVSSDRVVWAMAAYEIYKVTGDKDWLARTYLVVKNSLDDDKKVVFDPSSGMYRGESSFLDWREQTYPKWMQNADIYSSENLGTNVLHYLSLHICGEMAKELGLLDGVYFAESEQVKDSINSKLWMSDKGYYAQYLYGRDYLTQSPRFEALGEALSVISGVANDKMASSIYRQSPITEFGATCIYPQIPEITPYHNNAIWPFVQAYWNLGAAKVKNERALTHGLSAIYRAAALFLTNYENFVASNGDYYGTAINSDHMLWSMAGNIAMVHRVFLGMSFDTDGLLFNPVVPKAYSGKKELRNFKYRNSKLDITVNGFGSEITSFKVDGILQQGHKIASTIQGNHKIVIELNNRSFDSDSINLVENKFSLPAPMAFLKENVFCWNKVANAVKYVVYANGEILTTTTDSCVTISKNGEYKVTAIDQWHWESFSSEPVRYFSEGDILSIDLDGEKKNVFDYQVKGYTGEGFVDVSTTKNVEVICLLDIKEAGDFILDVRYSNGSGAWNTDNSCAIRTLYVNDVIAGSLVFPQRGTNEWSNWGFSNSVMVHLVRGGNVFRISFMSWDNNMNFVINRALLDNVRLYKIR